MIKNERQYRITKARAEEFAEALSDLEESGPDAGTSASEVHPLLKEAQEEALRSQHEELREELAAYEGLQERSALELSSLGELPLALVRARVAEGLTQKDLAERLGLKEQQIQRYEATEYASASWKRIQEVLDALGAHGEGKLRLPPGVPERSGGGEGKRIR